jgi:hypothetical protein
MSSFLKIDSGDLNQNGLNNSWTYRFPGSSANFQNVECPVQSISLFNSEYNIDSSAFANNSFQIQVPTSASVQNYLIVLPDGYYLYADINRMIQAKLVEVGAYLINATGDNFFYIQPTENSVNYSAQLDFSPTPITLPASWTRPATGLYSTGKGGMPTSTRTLRLIIDNVEFGKVLGLSAATYPAALQTTASVQLSNIIPQIHPSSSFVVRCDLIKNDNVISGDILAAFDRGDAGIGQLINYKPSNYCNRVTRGVPRVRRQVTQSTVDLYSGVVSVSHTND